MATTERTFETIPVGTNVTWRYRSAIGHGTVIGVHKIGTTAEELDRYAQRICSFVLREWLSAGTPGNKMSSAPTARSA